MPIDDCIAAIGRHPFWATFRLRGRERAFCQLRDGSRPSARRGALRRAGGPGRPPKDGRQTPYRGHAVFRRPARDRDALSHMLERWHQIPKGHALDADEQSYAVDVICRWIERELEG